MYYGEKSQWRNDDDARAVAIMATMLDIEERHLLPPRRTMEVLIEEAISTLEEAKQRVAARRELGKPGQDY